MRSTLSRSRADERGRLRMGARPNATRPPGPARDVVGRGVGLARREEKPHRRRGRQPDRLRRPGAAFSSRLGIFQMTYAPLASLEDQVACVRRELAMRERVYPRWVSEGRMTAAKA